MAASTDFLAWSEITNLNERELKQYARNVGISPKQARKDILDAIYGQIKVRQCLLEENTCTDFLIIQRHS